MSTLHPSVPTRSGARAPLFWGVWLLLLPGCAHTGMSVSREGADPIGETARRIEAISALPDSSVMDPAVQLVTFGMRSASGQGIRRDTIRTDGAVARWLLGLHAAQLPANEFLLKTSEVFLCREVAVQRGTYRIATGDAAGATATQAFMARWVPDEAGEWRLERLWLDPGSSVRVARLGAECRSGARAGPASKPFGVSFELGATGNPGGEMMHRTMTEAGWDVRQADDYPITRSDRWALTVRGSYRVAGATSAGLLYTRFADTSTRGSAGPPVYRPTLSLEGQTVYAAMVFHQLGPIEAGVGPGVVTGAVHWYHGSEFYHQEPVRENHAVFGAVGQIGGSAALPLGLYWSVTGRYGLFPAVETPEYLGLAPFEVPLSRGAGTLGLGLRF